MAKKGEHPDEVYKDFIDFALNNGNMFYQYDYFGDHIFPLLKRTPAVHARMVPEDKDTDNHYDRRPLLVLLTDYNEVAPALQGKDLSGFWDEEWVFLIADVMKRLFESTAKDPPKMEKSYSGHGAADRYECAQYAKAIKPILEEMDKLNKELEEIEKAETDDP